MANYRIRIEKEPEEPGCLTWIIVTIIIVTAIMMYGR